MKKPLLSIIVAAHHEGLVAHKTMLSIIRAVNELDKANINYEIIVTIDNGNKETLNYFNNYKNDKHVSVYPIKFGDLALSRNYGISKSDGKYIATIDADDLVSKNWFIDGLNFIKNAKGDVILHTQFSINFGTQNIIWEKFDSKSKEEDAVIMTWTNRWDSAIITTKKILESFPYQPNNNGFGSEDWNFNSDTLAADIPHIIVPKTILFVRRKEISEMTIQSASNRTVRYTNLLDFNFLKEINTSSYELIKGTSPSKLNRFIKRSNNFLRRNLIETHNKARSFKLYNKTTKKLAILAKKIDNKQNRFPDWLINEWRGIHVIDKEIFPDKYLIKNIQIYKSEIYELGVIFCKMAKYISKQPDYVIIVPYLIKGGAELVVLNYIKSIQKAHPKWNIAVITTLRSDNPWKDRLDSNIDFIPFGNLIHEFPENLQLQLLARFIVQSKTTRIHIAQSDLAFKFASKYNELLKSYKIYSFAFCEDSDNQGRIGSHVHSGLPKSYNVLYKIFTDNNSITKSLQKEYGYDDSKFITHYQPMDYKLISPHKRTDINKPLRILWASRIAKQKRPDILLRIAKELPYSDYNIDVYGVFQDGYSKEMFDNIKTIKYKGEFSGIDSIPTDNYDVFLYTSENDGVPNILLEVTSKGLVVIAPDIGGISEFISSSTGILIRDKENIQEYVESIKKIKNNDKLRLDLIKNAQIKLASQHSIDNFNKVVARDII